MTDCLCLHNVCYSKACSMYPMTPITRQRLTYCRLVTQDQKLGYKSKTQEFLTESSVYTR